MEEIREVNSNKWYNKSSSGNEDKLFDKRIWRVKDVARFLNCSVGHVYNLVAKEEIPNRKKGQLIFFIPDEVTQWILDF